MYYSMKKKKKNKNGNNNRISETKQWADLSNLSTLYILRSGLYKYFIFYWLATNINLFLEHFQRLSSV